MFSKQALKAGLISLLIFLLFIGAWSMATHQKAGPAVTGADAEYAALMGKSAEKTNGFPPPSKVGEAFVTYLSDPFYDKGPNDKGIAIQLAYSLGRVGLGFLLATLVALPVGFAIGMSPLLLQALNPFIQILKPISPLAWMPLALKGVTYRPVGAAQLLRNNLLVYGLGGLIVPFIGIKIIDVLLSAVGLA